MNHLLMIVIGLDIFVLIFFLTVYIPIVIQSSQSDSFDRGGNFQTSLLDLTFVEPIDYSKSSSTISQSLNSTEGHSLQPRVLCFVLTSEKYFETRAKAVNETWSKHCNLFYFVANRTYLDFPIVIYNGEDSYTKLWGKTKAGFKYAFENYFDAADWFLKADDDTFMIIENLKKVLVNYQPSDPVWLGCKFRLKVDYMSGGGGYVLSKEALKRFVTTGLEDRGSNICRTKDDDGYEDLEMGKCLQNLNVTPESTAEDNGRHRFFGLGPEHIIPPNKDFSGGWYWQYLADKSSSGPECCSNFTISFHYVNHLQMYTLNFFTYSLQV